MSKGKSVLTVKNLNKSFGNFQALKDINFRVESGELVAILGESGSGKSTLLNVISGLDELDSGEITINGISTRDFSHKEWAIYRNHYIGFVFQEYNLVDHLSVVENVELPLLLQGVSASEAREKALEKCKLLGLTNHTHKLPNRISGGQQQRVAIARALVTDPKVILADEPTGALDSENARIILDVLKVLSKDHIVLLVTHDEDYANEYATRIITLEDGRIISDTDEKYMRFENVDKLNLKRPKMKLNVMWKFARNNLKKRIFRTFFTSLTMSLGLIAIFLIIFLINGIRTEVTDIIGTFIPKDQYIVETEINSGQISDDNYKYIKNHEIVSEAFFNFTLYPLKEGGGGGKVYYYPADYEITTIPLNKDTFYYSNSLVGDYPSNNNEIIVTSRLAEWILQLTIKDGEYEEAVKLLKKEEFIIERVSKTTELNEKFTIVGIVRDARPIAYLRYPKMEALYKHITEEDKRDFYYFDIIDRSRLNVFFNTKNDKKIEDFINDIGKKELVLSNPIEVINRDANDFFHTALYVLISTASVSLVVAGILVGLIIYMSVLERIKEIGILTSLGARRSNIRHLFIFESGVIGFLSSLIALIFSVIIAVIINAIFTSTIAALFRMFGISIFEQFRLLHIDVLSIIIVFGVSIVYAIICGLIPAFLASKLKAVEALRKE